MSGITHTGNSIIVRFDSTNFSNDERDILKYAVWGFGHLLKPGETLSLTAFCKRIAQAYVVEGTTRVCVEVLQNAAVKGRYECTFRVLENGEFVEKQTTVVAERWAEVDEYLQEQFDTSVSDIRIRRITESYKNGILELSLANIASRVGEN